MRTFIPNQCLFLLPHKFCSPTPFHFKCLQNCLTCAFGSLNILFPTFKHMQCSSILLHGSCLQFSRMDVDLSQRRTNLKAYGSTKGIVHWKNYSATMKPIKRSSRRMSAPFGILYTYCNADCNLYPYKVRASAKWRME